MTTPTDEAPALTARQQDLAARVEAGMAWLTTDGLALGLNLSYLCDNLTQLTMSRMDLCVLGLSAPVGEDFNWAHRHLCYEGLDDHADLTDEQADRLSELEMAHYPDTEHCRAVALGFDLEVGHGGHDWDDLARMWTASLTPWCASQEDHR